METLAQKIALVTGAAHGVGRATSLAFARAGARVIVSDVDDAAGESTVAEIRAAGGEARFVRADVTREDDVRVLIDGTVTVYGRIDIAFNSASIGWGLRADGSELSREEWERVISVNLSGVWLSMKHELRQMRAKGGGAIVNNAAILGLMGLANPGASVAAKHGVVGLTRTAALEYAPYGVRVNAVCAGCMGTPTLARAGRFVGVADAVLFLASPAASFITGHPLVVDERFLPV